MAYLVEELINYRAMLMSMAHELPARPDRASESIWRDKPSKWLAAAKLGASTAADMAEQATVDPFLGLYQRMSADVLTRTEYDRSRSFQYESMSAKRTSLASIDSARVESPLWHRHSRIIERANEALQLAEKARDLTYSQQDSLRDLGRDGLYDAFSGGTSSRDFMRKGDHLNELNTHPRSPQVVRCNNSIDSSLFYLKKFTENASIPSPESNPDSLYDNIRRETNRNAALRFGERNERGLRRVKSTIGWGIGTVGSFLSVLAILVYLGPMKMYGTSSVILKPGDTLWELARIHLGSIAETDILLDCNPDIGSDPDFIQPGQRLRLPRKGWKRAMFGLGFSASRNSILESVGSKREKSIEAASATRKRYQQRLAVEAGLAGAAITAGAAHVIFGDSLLDLSNSGKISSKDALVSGLLGELNALSGNLSGKAVRLAD